MTYRPFFKDIAGELSERNLDKRNASKCYMKSGLLIKKLFS